MSLIDEHELSLPNSIIQTIDTLKPVYESINFDSLSYSIGFEHDFGFVSFQYNWGIVSLTIIEIWPLRVENVHSRKPLIECQRHVMEKYLRGRFKAVYKK